MGARLGSLADLVFRHWMTAELSEYRVTLVPAQRCLLIASATIMGKSYVGCGP